MPLHFNDGRPVDPEKFQELQESVLSQFGGLTFFPQPNKGFWRMAEITYRDEIVIYRVIASGAERIKAILEETQRASESRTRARGDTDR